MESLRSQRSRRRLSEVNLRRVGSLDSVGRKNMTGGFCDFRDDVEGNGLYEDSDEVQSEFFCAGLLRNMTSFSCHTACLF
jgi:hypothetical protein